MAMTDNSVVAPESHGVDQAPAATEFNADGLKKFNKFVTIGLQNQKKYEKWIERGDQLFRGTPSKKDDEANEYKPTGTKVNKLRRKIVASVSQIYSRNPRFIAKAKHPIMVPEDPQPQVSVDPMTGQQITTMASPIDPVTGLPAEKDISQDVAEIVSAIMDQIFQESCFKAEAKACCLEAHHRPASIMNVGYEYDPDNKKDDVYFRWRSFKKFIIDPDAVIYNGVVRKCRFMGISWSLRKEEAEGMGLNWSNMTSGKNPEKPSSEDDEVREVWQVWSQVHNQVAWLCENAPGFAKDPAPWPWQMDGYPFIILKLTEDIDRQFSKPLVLEAEDIQRELDEMRETMQNKIVGNRTMVLYDQDILSESDISAIAGRRQNGYKGIQGLSSRASPPLQIFNEDKLDAEFYSHYERNEMEMDSVLGTSANEQAQMIGKTAREVEEVAKNQGVMTSAKVDINADFMTNAARKAVQIMRQTYTEERVTQITTRDGARFWVKWKGSEILSEVDLSVDVGSIQKEDDDIRKQVALNLFQTLQNVPGISVKKLANDLLRTNGKPETEEYWLDEQQQQMQPQIDPATGQPLPPAPQQPVDVRASLAGQMSPQVQGG